MTRCFEYRHTVGFEETNLVGNVYYTNHLLWQGRCREMFLREHAPGIIPELSRGLALATTRCSCEYFTEVEALDDIVIEMSLAEQSANRLTLAFDYYRVKDDGRELIARGEQQIATLRRGASALEPVPLPNELRRALEPFGGR